MSRDSAIWNVLFGAGFAAAAVLIAGNAVDYGLSPVQFKWLQLLAASVTALGAKNGNSWVKDK